MQLFETCNEEAGKSKMRATSFADLKWPDVSERLSSSRAVILPLGSTEQHGPHMALCADSIVSEYVSHALAAATNCLVLPTLQYGQVWSANGFPGTIAIKQKVYVEFVKEIVVSIINNGARNVILFAGHYGNRKPCEIVARELRDEQNLSNIWYLSYTRVNELNNQIMETKLWNGATFHAGELETSILLAIAPDRVNMDVAVKEEPNVPLAYGITPLRWKDFSKTGAFGDPTKATAQKGVQFLDSWIKNLIEIVKDNIPDVLHDEEV